MRACELSQANVKQARNFTGETKAVAQEVRTTYFQYFFDARPACKGCTSRFRGSWFVAGSVARFHVLQVQRRELTGHLCEEISMEMEVRLALLIKDASTPYRQLGGMKFNPFVTV